MRHLWAPWRIQYILGRKPEGCFLCGAVNARRRRSRFMLAETEHAAVVLNKYPYAAGHVLVFPKAHVPDLDGLSADALTGLFSLLRDATAAVRTAFSPDGLNIGANIGKAAGAGLEEHFHLHVVPRWNGDHNFMPVLAETMIFSEHLAATYHRLLPYFDFINKKR